MKKSLAVALECLVWLAIWCLLMYIWYRNWLEKNTMNNPQSPLPAQELSEWLRWVYGIDKNINEKTIDNYLHRTDVVYRDVRMLEDSASWENKWWTRFPKDKYIFLMCGAGWYANFTKKMLIALWRDETKIYNVWWYRNYEWNRGISTINNNGNSVTYDFWKVPYYNIDFDSLTEK